MSFAGNLALGGEIKKIYVIFFWKSERYYFGNR
jgi:hypothetical protein